MATEESHTYLKTAQSAVNRHKERGHYDAATIHSIINAAPVAHVSFVPDPTNPIPVVLPMVARIGTFPGSADCPGDAEPAVYVHGYVSTRMFRSASSAVPNQGGKDDDDDDEAGGSNPEKGMPVCIAATKIDALVLALTPFSHSYDYRSAVVHGHGVLLDPGTRATPRNRAEIVWAMRLITDAMVAGRWEQTRTPPDEAEVAATRILKVRIHAASAKVRDSGVKDDAKDLADPAVRARVWTGTIPYAEVLGAPVPAETNRVPVVPPYVADHVREHNKRAGHGPAPGGLLARVMTSIFGQ